MTDLPACKHCHRPMRPWDTTRSDYPETVRRRTSTSCSACFNRGGKPPTQTYWNSQDLLNEIRHLAAPPEETLQRLNVTAAAVSRAAYRHGQLDIARQYGRLRDKRRYHAKKEMS